MLWRSVVTHGPRVRQRLYTRITPCFYAFEHAGISRGHVRDGPLSSFMGQKRFQHSSIPNNKDEQADYRDVDSAGSFDAQGLSTAAFLKKAYQDGALHIKPDQVGPFLAELSRPGDKMSATSLRNACAKIGMSIDAAYTLARLLVRSPGPVDRYQGRQILLAASHLGSTKALLYVIKTAAKFGQLEQKEILPLLQRVEKLSEQDPPIVPALIAQAKVSEHLGAYGLAATLYERAISYELKPEPSFAARAYQGLKQTYSVQSANFSKEERKITIDEKDTELDIVAALVGLARLQWDWLNERDGAMRNLKIAAFEYDDPSAYWYLASNLENTSKVVHKDASVDNTWILHVPYEWYEYAMKAAVSGHATACYHIGAFHYFSLMNPVPHIDDIKLRRMLLDSPLTDRGSNRLDTTYRWLMCAARAGHNYAYLIAQSVLLNFGKPHGRAAEYQRDIIQRIATGESTAGTQVGDREWSEDERALANRIHHYDGIENAAEDHKRNGSFNRKLDSVSPTQ